jgi:hypothetical protein
MRRTPLPPPTELPEARVVRAFLTNPRCRRLFRALLSGERILVAELNCTILGALGGNINDWTLWDEPIDRGLLRAAQAVPGKEAC